MPCPHYPQVIADARALRDAVQEPEAGLGGYEIVVVLIKRSCGCVATIAPSPAIAELAVRSLTVSMAASASQPDATEIIVPKTRGTN